MICYTPHVSQISHRKSNKRSQRRIDKAIGQTTDQKQSVRRLKSVNHTTTNATPHPPIQTSY